MNPKQKAFQLINIFFSYCESNFSRVEVAKKHVNEILSVIHQLKNNELKNFYEEVMKELDNLKF